MPNATVELWLNGAKVNSTSTDANGYYVFQDLLPATDYVVKFFPPDAQSSFTVATTGAAATDSNPNPATGEAPVTTKSSGSNLGAVGSGTLADDPTIDAGLVKYNLTLTEKLDTAGPFYPGQKVSFIVTPHNDGPSAALAGWSVTEALPAELTLDTMDGTGYDCVTTVGTCVADAALAAGADGKPITVTATINTSVWTPIKNVAYVSPSATDVAETKPLVVPTTDTDTTTDVTDNDAEAALTMKPVSVGDFVWYDVNRNGLQDAGEKPYEGMTVNLYDAQGVKVATEVTDANGYYSFTGLFPKTEYTVEFVKLATETFATKDVDAVTSNSPTADLTDSDANLADGKVTFTTTVSGENLATDPAAQTVADNPGIDAGVVSYNLKLTKALVPGGPYYQGSTVTFTLTPSNDQNVTTDVSNDPTADVTDSDADITSGRVPFVAEASGANSAKSPANPSIDAGLVQYNLTLTKVETSSAPYYLGSTAATSSLVTWTLTPHNDGPADALAGWSVTEVVPSGLTLVSMEGGTSYDCSSLPTCTSTVVLKGNSDGAPITVTARVTGTGDLRNVAYVAPKATDAPETNGLEIPPAGTITSDTPTDNDADDPITVASLVSIGDYVWFDTNRDGQQQFGEAPVSEVTVNLYDAQGMLVATTATNAFGFYSFVDLVPGAAYTVEFVKPANTTFTTADLGADNSDSDADVVTGKVAVTAPVTGTNSATNPDDRSFDAGLIKLVSIGDYVWFDTNRDGAQGADEAPVPNVTVNLYDAGGALVGTTTTDDAGFYSFNNLLALASYTVEFVKPADTVFTVADHAADGVDSDADVSTGKVTITAPATGNNSLTAPDDPTIDAGLIELVSLGDVAWFDTNRDGVQDAGEAPVPGVTVNLYDAAGAWWGRRRPTPLLVHRGPRR